MDYYYHNVAISLYDTNKRMRRTRTDNRVEYNGDRLNGGVTSHKEYNVDKKSPYATCLTPPIVSVWPITIF